MRWSFCIPTLPGSEENLFQVIRSIEAEFTNPHEYEILIMGGYDSKKLHTFGKLERLSYVKSFPYTEWQFHFQWKNFRKKLRRGKFTESLWRTGWITRKKNALVMQAQFENICLLHDYVLLEKNWRAGFEEFGEDWEVAITPILNQDGSRSRDWLAHDYPEIGPCLMPYDVLDLSRYMYISGTYFCVKRNFYLTHPLNEGLVWGESEDIEWSLRVRNLTRFALNLNSRVALHKLKPLDEPPYNDSWLNNAQDLAKALAKRN